MLTKADDYPIHQLSLPVSEVGTERNFYDRYFFNGYSKDGKVFFAVALCVYPNLNIMDGAFTVSHNGTQHNCRSSRILNQERLDTKVGSLEVQVIEPLKKLRVILNDKEAGISADLNFESKFEAMQEPKMNLTNGPRVVMDTTRLTQQGSWNGSIDIKKEKINFTTKDNYGTRDRSWGVRPVGAYDSQPVMPFKMPQFYWLWAPLHFPDFSTHTYFVDDEKGKLVTGHSVVQGTGYTDIEILTSPEKLVVYKPGTRRIKSAEFRTSKDDGTEIKIRIETYNLIFMCGIGYMHPDWGAGHYKGENETTYDTYDLSEDPQDPPFLHVQAFCKTTYESKNKVVEGVGILEQLLLGAHEPSGFKDLLDSPN